MGNWPLKPPYEKDCSRVMQGKGRLGHDLGAPASGVRAAPLLQRGFDQSLSFVGTQFSYQSTQMMGSDTSKFPPASYKVFLQDRGPYPQAQDVFASVLILSAFLYKAFMYHVFMCPVQNQALCRGHRGNSTVPVLAERGDTAPIKATLKIFSFFRGPAELPADSLCARPATFMWASLTLFPSSDGRSQEDF